jgi:hypothetical protein
MQLSHKRIILDSLRRELQYIEKELDRSSYFIGAMWERCQGKNSGTDDIFKNLNYYKTEVRNLKSRKAKLVSTITLVKSL